MAQTVSGTFKIYDRATGPLRKMEEQAKRTDAAMRDLGGNMDSVATQSQNRRYEESSRHLRTLQRDTDRSSGSMNKLGRSSDDLKTKLAKLGGAFYGLSKIFGILKIPAMAAGIGLLVKWVGQLAGGVVSLLPKIADLGGVMGALPVAFTGVGLAVGAVKLAFSDFTKALGGNKKAIENLTPEARKFLTTVKMYKPVMKELRQSAQQGLFPGLDEALRRAQRAVPTMKKLLGGAGAAVGQGASGLTRSLTSNGFLSDLTKVGTEGTRVIRSLFVVAGDLAHAFMDVGVAAIPFTRWLEHVVKNGAHAIRTMTETGRQTGSLAKYFDRTKDSLKTFGSILQNLWGVFKGIGHASRALGDDLWSSAVKATDAWDKWVNSAVGQAKLMEFFNNSKGTIHETLGLVGDLAKAIFRLSNTGGMGGLIRKLREMVPTIEKIFGNTSKELGGPLLDAVKNFLEIFSNTPYFGSFVKLLAQMSNLVGFLVQKLPILQPLIMGIVAYKLFGPAIAAVSKLAGSWGLVATNASAAAAATSAATGSSAMAAGGTAGRMGVVGRYKALRNPPATGYMPPTMPGQSIMLPMASGTQAVPRAGRISAARGAMAGLGGAAMAGMGGIARAFWPIAAIMGLSGAVSGYQNGGNVAGGLTGLASGATMGMIPAPLSADERGKSVYEQTQKALMKRGRSTVTSDGGFFGQSSSSYVGGLAGGDNPTGLQAIKSLDQLRSQMAARRKEDLWNQKEGNHVSKENAEAERQILKALQDQYRVRKQIAAAYIQSQSAKALDKANAAIPDAAKAYLIDTKNKDPKAMSRMMQRIGSTNAKLGDGRLRFDPAHQQYGEGMLAWAKKLEAAGGPKDTVEKVTAALKRSWARMGRSINVVNGDILTGTRSEWHGIQEALGSEAEKAKARGMAAFTALQQAAVGSLRSMGFSKMQANAIVQGNEKGKSQGQSLHDLGTGGTGAQINHRGNARGGRIPGRGLQDTIPVAPGQLAAPGELIVNRHTESRVDRVLRQAGTSLGQEVGREGRPHSAPKVAGTVMGRDTHGRRPGPTRGRAARGSRVAAAGVAAAGQDLGGFSGGDIVALGKFLQSKGFAVGENPAFGGVHPVHVANSWHYKGLALDVNADSMAGGEMANLDRLNAWLQSNYNRLGLVELLWRVPNHFDHLHVAMSGTGQASGALAGGAAGGVAQAVKQMKALKAPRSGLRGVPGALADRASQIYAAGLTKKVNKNLRRRGGKGAGGAGPPGAGEVVTASVFGGPGDGDVIGNTKYGWAELSNPPSSLNFSALGNLPRGDAGAIRVTSGGKSIVVPKVDVGAGGPGLNGHIRAIDLTYSAAQKLGFSGLGDVRWEKAARGGRIGNAGWFGGGGSISAHGPTVLGLGEHGSGSPETATITRGKPGAHIKPAGSGRAVVKIGQIIVQNHRKGDIKKQVKEEVEQAFTELADTLDVQPMYDDTEAVA